MSFADLHLHTNFSDGTYSPEELAERASQMGLAAVALTDHDTVEGCARMSVACRRAGLEFIPSTELTAEFNGNELHLLGYFVDTQNRRLLNEMARFQQVRQDRIREMVARLNRLNVPLRADAHVYDYRNRRLQQHLAGEHGCLHLEGGHDPADDCGQRHHSDFGLQSDGGSNQCRPWQRDSDR